MLRKVNKNLVELPTTQQVEILDDLEGKKTSTLFLVCSFVISVKYKP